MDRREINEDLAFVHDKLGKHPLFIICPDKLPEFERLYGDILDRSGDRFNLVDAMTTLTVFFSDSHTNIELPYTSKDKCLNIPCDWRGDRLMLLDEYEGVPRYGEVIAIENTPIEDLVGFMSERIPHENIYLVKSRMVRYPYQNYHLLSEMNLKRLFNREHYEISFFSEGEIISRQCELRGYNGFLRFYGEDDFLSYEINAETLTLHVNACIYNEKYKAALKTLSELCGKNDIKAFILDLSQNMGGSSAVIDEFIKYVDIEEFHRYEMIDYSSGIPKHITRRRDLVKNTRSETRFPANLYCKVSHHTLSSARTFAVTLKDNGIAAIIGTPTGGKPSSFGMPKRFKTPHSEIAFRVSSCMFLRPNADADDAISLFPDKMSPNG